MRLRNSVYNTICLMIQQIVVAIYGLIVPSLIIKSYGSNVNGVISSISQFLSYIALLESGVGAVITAALYKPLAGGDNKKISGIVVATERFFRKIAEIFLVYIVILLFVYPSIVNDQFSKVYTITLILIISISTFAQYYFGITYQLLLEADQKKRIVSMIQIASTICTLFLTVICVYIGTTVHVLKSITACVYIIRPIFLNCYVKNKYKLDKNVKPDNQSLKQRWNGLAHHIAYIIHYNTDITILTFFVNVLEVSVYSVYYNVVSNVYKLISSLSGGIKASVGNLIACEKNEKVEQVLNQFETLYFILINIFYSCTIILIVPFVDIYTKGVTDVNYIRPIFSIILSCSEAAYALRDPYDMIIFASGHFKQTKMGAYEEAAINIIISLILVRKYGVIGVAIGTLIAMLFRVFQYVYYLKNNILFRSPGLFFKKLVLNILVGSLLILFFKNIVIEVKNYLEWFTYAMIVFSGVSIVVIFINSLCYKKEMKEIILYLKKLC